MRTRHKNFPLDVERRHRSDEMVFRKYKATTLNRAWFEIFIYCNRNFDSDIDWVIGRVAGTDFQIFYIIALSNQGRTVQLFNETDGINWWSVQFQFPRVIGQEKWKLKKFMLIALRLELRLCLFKPSFWPPSQMFSLQHGPQHDRKFYIDTRLDIAPDPKHVNKIPFNDWLLAISGLVSIIHLNLIDVESIVQCYQSMYIFYYLQYIFVLLGIYNNHYNREISYSSIRQFQIKINYLIGFICICFITRLFRASL